LIDFAAQGDETDGLHSKSLTSQVSRSTSHITSLTCDVIRGT